MRMEFQELQQVHEEQEDVLCWKERELVAIKGALQEEISAHAKEVEALKEQHKEEIQKLLKAKEEVTEVSGINMDHHFHLFNVPKRKMGLFIVLLSSVTLLCSW